jgi:hypothetical protein
MRQMMGAFFQYEKSSLVAKLRGARQRIRNRAGHCEGRKPYGYRPEEQPILERMKALRASGMAVDTIAATLNDEGIKSRSGLLWYGSTINRIVKPKA